MRAPIDHARRSQPVARLVGAAPAQVRSSRRCAAELTSAQRHALGMQMTTAGMMIIVAAAAAAAVSSDARDNQSSARC